MTSTDSCEEALHTELVLGEILKRSRGSQAFLRASLVSKFWLETARVLAVIRGFTNRNKASFIGFVFEHAPGFGPEYKLITSPGAAADDPARAMREKFSSDGLHGKYVLGTYGGRVISRIEAGKRQGRIYMNCPYSAKPRAFTSLGQPLSPMLKNPGENTYGQFAVVTQIDGPDNNFPVFFVRDPSEQYDQDHEGVKFKTDGRVCVHVSIFKNGGWVSHVSDPQTPSSVTFQRTPYCVQAGAKLYMMYLLTHIVWFDMEKETFGGVDLPGQMGSTIRGCLQYTAGPHAAGDVQIVYLDKAKLVRWVLTRREDTTEWNQEASVDLVTAFGQKINPTILEALSVQPSEWRGIQVRSVSPDGRFVLITVGVIYGLFVVDMAKNCARAVPKLSKIGRVFPLSENCPIEP